jgi:hypothetical protein
MTPFRSKEKPNVKTNLRLTRRTPAYRNPSLSVEERVAATFTTWAATAMARSASAGG